MHDEEFDRCGELSQCRDFKDFKRISAEEAEYRRLLHHVAERQVIDEAEGVVADAWVAELDEIKRAALGLAAVARIAQTAARSALHDARRSGGPDAWMRAARRLKAIEVEQFSSIEAARTTLDSVDAELAITSRAGLNRARRGKADVHLLKHAWLAAFGVDAIHVSGIDIDD